MDSDEDDRTVIRPPGAPLTAHRSDVPSAAPETIATPDAMAPTIRTGPPAAPATSSTTNTTSPGSSHAITLPPGTRLLEFEITQTVGEGGFGIVYAAWDHSLDRRVALKEYMPSSLAFRSGQSEIQPRSERHRETFDAGLKSFVNEAKLLAQFDHPSLLKVYRFWEANGTAYMVMPFLEGSTVRDTVRAMAGPPDEAWIRSLLAPLFDALAMLHASQIYHRDIAPDNIHLLADTGRPLLLDFGAARRVIGDMTQALTAILKPGYAPVEQYADIPGLKQGPWTDVYALAAVVHWMITGKTPPPSVGRMFDDAHVPLGKRVADRYSPGFLEAVDRALVVMPNKRTQTIEAFRNDLHGGVSDEAPVTQSRAPAAVATTRGSAALASSRVTTAIDEVTQAGPHAQHPVPATQTKLARSSDATPQSVPPTGSARRWAISAAIIATFAVAGAIGLFVVGRSPTPPAVNATTLPKSSVATAPAATAAREILPAASSLAAPPRVPLPVTESPAATTETPNAAQTPTAEPSTPAVVEGATPARPPVAVVEGPAKSGARPPVRRTAEPRPERRDEPTATEPRAVNASQAECGRLFQRLSMGESSPELIERVRTLHCR